jgi:HAD superfamily hydrolase (TIGR01549 family)
MSKIEHIIFDLGNVLVHIHPERAIQAFVNKCGLSSDIIKTFYLSNSHLSFMEGAFSPEEFFQLMIKQYPCDLSLHEFMTIWNLVIGNPKNGIPDIISKLKDSYILSICSNTDPWHWDLILKENAFINNFDHYFLSFDLHLNKPHAGVFQHVLKRLPANGPDCIFIDDSKENIEAAESLGIHGIHASEPQEIIHGLKSYGLRIDL